MNRPTNNLPHTLMAQPFSHHRRSIRLPDYDYSQPGEYFITLVTHQRKPLFGKIHGGEMQLTPSGQIVWDVLESLPARYSQISLGSAIVMPDHIHVIIIIDDPIVGTNQQGAVQPQQPQPQNDTLARRRMLLPLVVGYLKMNSAKQINTLRGTPGVSIWQRNYYEHVIQSDHEYERIEAYIANNPSNWLTDTEFVR